jgi:AcrR family transcriptional regulator
MSFKDSPFGPDRRRGYHHGRLKDALIEAARALVAERGPAGFTLAEAAKRVGVTAAAPYRHFTDRDQLIGELARQGFETFDARLREAWDSGRPRPDEAFRRMGRAYLLFARSEPGLYAAMFNDPAEIGRAAAPDSGRRAFETLAGAAAATLASRGGPAAATAPDIHRLACEIWAFSHGVAMLAVAGHLDGAAGMDPEQLLMRGIDTLIEAAASRAKNRMEAAQPRP